FFRFGIIIVLLEIIVCFLTFYTLIKKMKRMQLFGKIILSDSIKNKKEFANLEEFIGREGMTKTALRPTGDAEFNGVILEVMSENGYIDNNTKIKVTRILENKLYVKQLNYN
ncbi:MAG: NfeD family protein, partial [Eubacteriales bacterium]|nr:NfeD family protein [Eubacteriales bacterium]